MTTTLHTGQITATIPAPPAERVPTHRVADCRYCDRYGRACGRHESRTPNNVRPGWGGTPDAVTRAVAAVVEAETGIVTEGIRCLAASHAADRAIAAMDTSKIHPGIPSARLILAGRLTYAATCTRVAALDKITDTARATNAMLAATTMDEARHILAGCHGRCCGHTVRPEATRCVL